MKRSVIAEIEILPIGTESTSVSSYIADRVNIVKQDQDISYQLTAMGAIIQGPLERMLELARQMHEVPFTAGVKRVITIINIDDRRDKPMTIESKVNTVTQKIDTACTN